MRNEKYYYIRDERKRPIITVCLVRAERANGDDIARGIAVCSEKDSPCKKVGRAIAKARAIYALTSEKDNLEMNRSWLPLLAFSFGFPKSYFNPKLTKYEKRLFESQPEDNLEPKST